ncbi:MAG: site-specific integrase [Chloroflexi bacterium]|nr:site-specific integrase [Chloroflexota bacterium]
MATGYIRKRGNRSWQLTYDAPRGGDGKRRQRYETVHGKKRHAQARLNEILHSLNRGEYREPTTITVDEYLELWLRDYVRPNLRPRTAEGYGTIIHKHVLPSLGQIRLADLSPRHIQSYYSALLDRLSAQTIKHHHTLLHRAFEIAITWELLDRNPTQRVRTPKPKPSPARTLSTGEVRRLLAGARQTPYHVPIHLALYAGLRRGEILGLRWQDVDMDANTLSIHQTLMHVRGQGYIWGEPKSEGSRRTIAVSPATILLLRSHRERMEAEYAARGITAVLEQVCALPNGRLMKPDALSRACRRIACQCDIQGMRLHDLRHTHASLLLSEGTPIHIVQARLGHQSITTTVDIYGHVPQEADIAAGAAFARVVDTDVGKMWAIDEG